MRANISISREQIWLNFVAECKRRKTSASRKIENYIGWQLHEWEFEAECQKAQGLSTESQQAKPPTVAEIEAGRRAVEEAYAEHMASQAS